MFGEFMPGHSEKANAWVVANFGGRAACCTLKLVGKLEQAFVRNNDHPGLFFLYYEEMTIKNPDTLSLKNFKLRIIHKQATFLRKEAKIPTKQ